MWYSFQKFLSHKVKLSWNHNPPHTVVFDWSTSQSTSYGSSMKLSLQQNTWAFLFSCHMRVETVTQYIECNVVRIVLLWGKITRSHTCLLVLLVFYSIVGALTDSSACSVTVLWYMDRLSKRYSIRSLLVSFTGAGTITHICWHDFKNIPLTPTSFLQFCHFFPPKKPAKIQLTAASVHYI